MKDFLYYNFYTTCIKMGLLRIEARPETVDKLGELTVLETKWFWKK